jgi:hypothetical protein
VHWGLRLASVGVSLPAIEPDALAQLQLGWSCAG